MAKPLSKGLLAVLRDALEMAWHHLSERGAWEEVTLDDSTEARELAAAVARHKQGDEDEDEDEDDGDEVNLTVFAADILKYFKDTLTVRELNDAEVQALTEALQAGSDEIGELGCDEVRLKDTAANRKVAKGVVGHDVDEEERDEIVLSRDGGDLVLSASRVLKYVKALLEGEYEE